MPSQVEVVENVCQGRQEVKRGAADKEGALILPDSSRSLVRSKAGRK
jgi:hypothetical protein